MERKWKERYSQKFRRRAVARMNACENIVRLSRELGLKDGRHYGYRRVTAELRRRGMMMNHKRVARIMRLDNLLTIQNPQLGQATDSEHEPQIYLNLASRMKVCGPNQLWIADITYIRLKAEFIYLAVVLDAFSRKVVGWSLDRSLQARLPTSALEKAIVSRQPPPGVVHHSDQGVQYRCGGYLRVLRDHGMVASISRPGYPYDNASCESFMKTLKREEIYAHDYRDLENLLGSVERFIENYYHRCRLHSALGYRSPEEFENEWEDQNYEPSSGAATVSVFSTLTRASD